MRHKNPAFMEEIVQFAEHFYASNGRSPSCNEIARNTTLKRSAVHNYLVEMNERGMIEYNGQTIMTPNIREMQNGMRRIGIVGSIACGIPTDATIEQDEYINLPMIITGHDEVYILYATGDSMTGAGIDDGDMVLVRRQETAHPGDIVVAYVEGEGNTLKRLRMENGHPFLHPENPEMSDIPADFLKIQGVAIWVFKKI